MNMRTIDIPGGQGSPEWHAHRRQYRNASDAPAMMGVSPYKTRSELLREIATGYVPDVDSAKQRIFDAGHQFEAWARPLAEDLLGETLYPLVKANGNLSASLDGQVLMGDIDFEHKTLNETLREILPVDGIGGPEVGAALPMVYRVQIAQQHYCGGATKTLFTASSWSREGDLIEARHCWVERDEALIADVLAGWVQFERDLEAYVPEEKAAPLVAEAMEHLPAVSVQVSGALVVASNLKPFGEALTAFIERMPKEPETDQDFVTLDAACKRLELAEKALEQAETNALTSISDVAELQRLVRQFRELARTQRLASEKVVKTRKDEIKSREVKNRHQAMTEYIAAANGRLGGAHIIGTYVDFAAVIKGLRSLDSARDKLDTALAQAKINVDAAENKVQANLNAIAAAGADMQALFADKATLVQKDPEAVQAIVSQRVAAENQRLEAIKTAAAAAAAAPPPAPAPVPVVESAPVAAPAPATGAALIGGSLSKPVFAVGGGFGVAPAATAPQPDVKLGDINASLGFDLREVFIREVLEVGPVESKGRAVMFSAGSLPLIKARLLAHIQGVTLGVVPKREEVDA